MGRSVEYASASAFLGQQMHLYDEAYKTSVFLYAPPYDKLTCPIASSIGIFEVHHGQRVDLGASCTITILVNLCVKQHALTVWGTSMQRSKTYDAA